MSWTKIVIWIIVIPILILVLLISLYFANNLLIGPVRHYFNTEWAEEINDDTWENGSADIYKVEAKISLDGQITTRTKDFVFIRKVETADTTFKNGAPMIWDSVRSFSQFTDGGLAFAISDTHRFRYGLSAKKEDFDKLFIGGEAQFSLNAQLIFKGTPETICFYKTKNGHAQFGRLKTFPVKVISKGSVQIKDLLSREEFGFADRALIKVKERSELTAQERWSKYRGRPPTGFHKNKTEQCWWGNAGCPQIAQKLCEL